MNDIKQKGFTLIEMLVAIGVFSVVSVTTVSLIVSLVRVQERVHMFQFLQDNIRFSMDFMNRSMIGGQNFRIISPAINTPNIFTPLPNDGLVNDERDGEALLYLHPNGKHVAYRLRNGAVEIWTEGSPTGYVRMTDPRVVVKRLRFYVSGAAANNKKQPRITIIFQAEVPDPRGGEPVILDLEATNSQRVIDS